MFDVCASTLIDARQGSIYQLCQLTIFVPQQESSSHTHQYEWCSNFPVDSCCIEWPIAFWLLSIWTSYLDTCCEGPIYTQDQNLTVIVHQYEQCCICFFLPIFYYCCWFRITYAGKMLSSEMAYDISQTLVALLMLGNCRRTGNGHTFILNLPR